ncbi:MULTISPECIES: hypothetical protein [Sphingobium]|uniref:hypothetical protein n=1 Tax=Sphingobium TaxID=165695 RepID=UPI001BECBD31|nr:MULTISPECIES: hypothetical protein [Sphingobium]MBT2245096.1 hypothetical protein [Sphingobium sp. BHU LFT2]WBQ18937.1 hypothetical protein PAE53_24060 [Sphingobium yanoikuyae]
MLAGHPYGALNILANASLLSGLLATVSRLDNFLRWALNSEHFLKIRHVSGNNNRCTAAAFLRGSKLPKAQLALPQAAIVRFRQYPDLLWNDDQPQKTLLALCGPLARCRHKLTL